jgi:Protein of unknown function (DUF3433)
MSRSPTPAKASILTRGGNIPIMSAFQALVQRRDIFLATIAFVAVLSDILIIVSGAVPFSAGEIYLELLVCSYVTMAILAIMIITIVAVIIWRRKTPYMPREPDTVAGVLSYVADSKLLSELDGCEYLTTKELEKRIIGNGNSYVYEEVRGIDGVQRFIVDGRAIGT